MRTNSKRFGRAASSEIQRQAKISQPINGGPTRQFTDEEKHAIAQAIAAGQVKRIPWPQGSGS